MLHTTAVYYTALSLAALWLRASACVAAHVCTARVCVYSCVRIRPSIRVCVCVRVRVVCRERLQVFLVRVTPPRVHDHSALKFTSRNGRRETVGRQSRRVPSSFTADHRFCGSLSQKSCGLSHPSVCISSRKVVVASLRGPEATCSVVRACFFASALRFDRKRVRVVHFDASPWQRSITILTRVAVIRLLCNAIYPRRNVLIGRHCRRRSSAGLSGSRGWRWRFRQPPRSRGESLCCAICRRWWVCLVLVVATSSCRLFGFRLPSETNIDFKTIVNFFFFLKTLFGAINFVQKLRLVSPYLFIHNLYYAFNE